VELSRHIFLFATTIPSKEEFSADGLAFGITRHVRYDYNVGIQAQWSYLRMRFTNWGSEVRHIEEVLESKLGLASYVLRFTVQSETRPVYDLEHFQSSKGG
jgi:hypothetical protein